MSGRSSSFLTKTVIRSPLQLLLPLRFQMVLPRIPVFIILINITLLGLVDFNGAVSSPSHKLGLLVQATYHINSTASLTTVKDLGHLCSNLKCFPSDLTSTVKEAIKSTENWLSGNDKTMKGQFSTRMDLTTVWKDSGGCDEKTALGETVILQREKVDVIVGPSCPASLRVVALLGSYWSKPVVTWAPVFREVIRQSSYDEVISTFGAFEDFAHAAVLVMRHLKWTKVAIIYQMDGQCEHLIEEIRQSLFQQNIATEAKSVLVSEDNITALHDELQEIKMLTRTIVVCLPPDSMDKLLSSAEALDMTSGYYAFLQMTFGLTPGAISTSKKGPKMENSGTVLQLGQFGNGKNELRGSTKKGKREVRLFEDYSRTEVMMSPYLHDAVVVAVVAAYHHARKVSMKGFNVTAPHLKTGNISIDDDGVRRATFSLVHRQQNDFVIVAMVTPDNGLELQEPIIWPEGSVPVSQLTCGAPGHTCADVTGTVAGAIVGVLCFVGAFAAAVVLYRRHQRSRLASKKDWLVDDREVKRRKVKAALGNALSNGTANGSVKKRLVRMETRGTLGLGSNCSLDKNMLYAPIGNYKDMVVAVKHVRWTNIQLNKKTMLQDLKMVKELSHDNVNQFVGAHVSSTVGASYVLFRYCAKGSLQDVLENDDIKLDWMFKLSFALDLARGMDYLHKSPLRSHGNLKSSNCVIDSRWVLKVTDFGAIVSYKKLGVDDDVDRRVYFNSLLWTAPEVLRMPKRPHKGTQKGDVYSFAIIMQEILLRCAPYFYNNMDPEDIITLIKNKNHRRPYRPVVPNENDSPSKAFSLMISCWAELPDTRPDFHTIRKKLTEMNGTKRFNIMDNMLQMLETYSSNLEQLVTERTEELEAEKKKTDTLLYQMLPPSVAEQLKSGMSVTPESFDHVSIFFSDIVGFTAIASQSRPLEVVDLLNDLYTCFDEVIARRDVYKVETIGDAYMCVSGCPKRNSNRHSGEIANMALDLISAVTSFRIRHKPEERLNLRVGLHTGACAAGVVGRTMPRYCLFGDTVNMASRMESTGKALNIHMSREMKEALDELDWGFIMVERGFIEVKGKGLQKTFWLAGKKHYKKPLPDSLIELQKRVEEGEPLPTPSYCTLTVGDSMFSALRKTSITVSNITVETSPHNSDSEDAVSVHCHPTESNSSTAKDFNGNDDAAITASTNTISLGPVPKRRHATVAPAEFPRTHVNEPEYVDWSNTKTKAEAEGEGDKNATDAQNQNKAEGKTFTSPVKQAIKKDSACYSISDNNSETDLTRVDILNGSQTDFRSDADNGSMQTGNGHSSHIGDGHSSLIGGEHGTNNQSHVPNTNDVKVISENSGPVLGTRTARRKYYARHGLIDPNDIPRIEIT